MGLANILRHSSQSQPSSSQILTVTVSAKLPNCQPSALHLDHPEVALSVTLPVIPSAAADCARFGPCQVHGQLCWAVWARIQAFRPGVDAPSPVQTSLLQQCELTHASPQEGLWVHPTEEGLNMWCPHRLLGLQTICRGPLGSFLEVQLGLVVYHIFCDTHCVV